MLPSKEFGNYRILRKLGRGMTDVYLAFDTVNNRHAVLKIVEESPDSLTKLIMEAERRGAALQEQLHEFDSRVVEVFEFGDLDGCFFIAMQYIEGKNVAELLREERRLDAHRAVKLVSEICSQLDRLHSFSAEIDGQRRAIVHGDIKPSNIQIGLNDEVRLLDFGIAKAITFTHHLTHHNFGSPSYCSPERLSKAQVDAHADLWAVGVTLYEMVAGMPPYQAETTRKLEALIQSRRPPRALPEDCPAGLKAILHKALAGDLHQRYVSAAALREDLQLFLQDRQPAAEKERRVAWIVNDTIQKPKQDHTTVDKPRPVFNDTATFFAPKRLASALSLVSALLWGLLAGLLIFVPAGYVYRAWHQSRPLHANLDHARQSAVEIDSDWDLYKRLEQHSHWLGSWSPMVSTGRTLRASYLAAADEVIDRYHDSSDPAPEHFDWAKAALCLKHAIEMQPADRVSQGKLALCEGYIALPQAESAKNHFAQAANLLPKSPDPHLGLARVYVYVLKNAGQAMAEFHEAQRLGYLLGPREIEQEADGYRLRANQELAEARSLKGAPASRLLELAQRDFVRARQLYEPILGFSNASASLRHLDDEERDRDQFAQASLQRPVVAAPVKRRVLSRGRRWQ